MRRFGLIQVISALGLHLGLGGVFASAGSSPADPSTGDPQNAGAPKPPPPPKAGASKPNVPETHSRFWVAPNLVGKTGGGGPGVQAGPMPGPMSQETLMSPTVQTLLGQYGVTPSQTPPDPNLFIHNPAAFEKHPVLAGMVERALRSVAGFHEGKTFMDSLTGTLQGGQEEDVKSAMQRNAQLMAPIQQAQAIQSLQHGADEHATAVGDQFYKQGMLHVAQQNLAIEQQRANYHPDTNNPDGTVSRWNPEANNGHGDYEVDPKRGRNEELYQKNQYYEGALHQLAVSKYEGDVTKITPDDIASIHNNWETMMSRAKGAASEDNNRRTTAARVTAAYAKGTSGSLKLNPADNEIIKGLDVQDKNLDSVAKGRDPFRTPDGKMLVPFSTARAAWVATEKAKLKTQRDEVLKPYLSKSSSTASPALPTSPMTALPNNPPTGKYPPGFIPLVPH